MCETRRICDDGVRNKWFRFVGIAFLALASFARISARLPSAFHDLSHSLLTFADVAVSDGLYPWDQAWVPDHECHQLRWIPANIEELEAIILNKSLERAVSCQPHAMAY